MKRIIVGTAGHIDHGKTRLIEALTGTDCDRWEEEKRRGITIDLGFAHLESEGLQIGFIDVPGHERFLDNALAGLGGIRVMLLVVAADEGVEPQTREHLAICQLLEIPAGIVALTKSDLVDSDTLELAELEIDELLAPTSFAGSEVVAVSSVSGNGIDELKQRLVALSERLATDPDPHRPTRLPIDRVFGLKGLGQLVTGTLSAGEIARGDTLTAIPGGQQVRVRSIQVHGQDRERAVEGERTALRLGGVEAGQLERGTQLVTADGYRDSRHLLTRLTLLPEAPAAIEGPTAVRVHLATSEILGRLYPIAGSVIDPDSTADAEIRLARPFAVARGDRFIIRRPSPPLTLGGGEVLDPFWSRPRGKRLEKARSSLTGDDLQAIRLWVEDAGAGGLSTLAVAQRLGVRRERADELLKRLAKEQRVLVAPAGQGREERWLVPATFERILRRAKRVLREHFGRQRLSESMSKAEAIERILPGKAAELAEVYLQWLAAGNVLVVDGDRVTTPGRTAEMSSEESQLSRTLLSLLEQGGLKPPSPAELKQATAAKPQVVDGVLKYLQESGKIVQLPGGLLIATSAIEMVRRDLTKAASPEFGVGDFKRQFDLSRKWAIPLLEHLDSVGFTRRIGDRRQIVGASQGED